MFIPKSVVCLKNYNKSTFYSDLSAGITVGVVALPLAMAFAIASGISPEKGLFTAIVAGFLISLLGGSRTQIGGPTGAFVVLVSSVLTQFGYNGLVICTFLAGLILIALGLARFGGMIKFIPYPVITGFTSGIAIVIFSTQIKDLFGLTIDKVPAEFLDKWAVYFKHFATINYTATTVGLSTIAGIVLLRKYAPKLPAMLIVMSAATLITYFFNLSIETIGSRFGDLPNSLPKPSIPNVPWENIGELIKPAFTIAFLAGIESLLSATVADGMTGTRHKSNMELIAQGIANVGSAFFGGIPATGAIARTATNVRAGGKTPIAGMIHAVTLLLILVLFAPFAKNIPLACLAGILVIISYQMSEIKHFYSLLSSPRSDVLVLITTFLLTVLIDLTVAVEVGVVLSAFLFIKRMSEVTNITAVTNDLSDTEETDDSNATSLRQIPPEVFVYEINGPFFFGAAEKFKNAMDILKSKPKVLILRMRHVSAIDATGLHVLDDLNTRCTKEGTLLILSDVHTQPIMALKRSSISEHFGDRCITGDFDEALKVANEEINK